MKYLLIGITFASMFVSGPAQAQTFAQKHPRRAEVLRRDHREINANNRAAANGRISNRQAGHLDREDRAIHREERRDAARNGGYITKGQQARINRQENRVNRQRRADERRDAHNY